MTSTPIPTLTPTTTAALGLAGLGLPANPDRGPVAVLPLRGKAPAIPGSRGVLDATADPALVRAQFARWRPTGVGVRVPDWAVVLDVDPRAHGDATLDRLQAVHGPLPVTLTVRTGRGDGGYHLWFVRPAGRITGRQLPGIDVKAAGYVVAPPSIHPDTGRPYRWATVVPVTAMTSWLAALIIEPEPVAQVVPRSWGLRGGCLAMPGSVSVVEAINQAVTWHDVLDRHGWRCTKGDGDSDASAWLHPQATSRCSATVRGARLYVWSTNTGFEPSGPGRPRGYSKAEALALLDHGGDLRALVAAVQTRGVVA